MRPCCAGSSGGTPTRSSSALPRSRRSASSIAAAAARRTSPRRSESQGTRFRTRSRARSGRSAAPAGPRRSPTPVPAAGSILPIAKTNHFAVVPWHVRYFHKLLPPMEGSRHARSCYVSHRPRRSSRPPHRARQPGPDSPSDLVALAVRAERQMTALPDYRHEMPQSLADKVIARLPESAFGNTEWVTMTARTGSEHLRAAIASKSPHRISNAIRSMAHTPRLDDVETLANTICDTMALDGYATRNTETIGQVTNARQLIADVLFELRGRTQPASLDPSPLREIVNGYVQLIALHSPQMSERLDAVGAFAERLARAIKLPTASVIEVELAGRLHDIGMIEVPRPARCLLYTS